MGWSTVPKVIKFIKPQVKKTGTKELVEHFKKSVTGLTNKSKAEIYKSTVAPYVKKWSGKKKDILTEKTKAIQKRNEESKKLFKKPK